MSEPRGPLDAAIEVLGTWELWNVTRTDYDAAIRVLEDWPKWEPLIEAAGKVDRQNAELVLCHITDIALGRHHEEWEVFYGQIRALIETLPEED